MWDNELMQESDREQGGGSGGKEAVHHRDESRLQCLCIMCEERKRKVRAFIPYHHQALNHTVHQADVTPLAPLEGFRLKLKYPPIEPPLGWISKLCFGKRQRQACERSRG